MNRLFIIMGLFFILIVPQASAQTSQYPSPYRQTMWNSFTDGMHTLGQNPKKAEWTKRKLHQARTTKRINDINRAKRQAWLNSK